MTDDFAASRRPLLEDPAREQKQAWLGQQSDRDLIKTASGPHDHTSEMELQRRLKATVEKLTEEIVTFRKSADTAAGRSDTAARKLERLTNWLIGFTAGLVVLTASLVVLTIVLVHRS